MAKKAVLLIGVLTALCAGVFLYGSHRARRLPDNNPKAFLSSNIDRAGMKVLVCIGDSITHGSVSHNYVDMLSEKTGGKNLIVVNAGVNDYLAYNALADIDNVIRSRPDFVTILIGTNDANASISRENAARSIRNMKLPRPPDREWFAENLSGICRRLKSETKAKIALLSIPPIGESTEAPSFRASVEYSAVIRETARREGCAYLPLNETMTAYLKTNPRPQRHSYSESQSLMYRSIFRHFILGESFDEISSRYGFMLLTDFLHLNGRAAGMVADLILEFIGDR